MFRKGDRRLLGAVFVLVGAILLGAALFTPWYSLDKSGTSGGFNTKWDFNTIYFLGLPSWEGTVQYSCSDAGLCPSESSYASVSLNNTGVVTETVLLLVSAATTMAFIAAAFAVIYRRNEKRESGLVLLTGAAVVLGAVATVLYSTTFQFFSDGPRSGFWGTSSGVNTLGPWTSTWGPSIGWYLAVAGAAALLGGMVILLRFRPDMMATRPESASRNSTT
jgi:hypothetical protein